MIGPIGPFFPVVHSLLRTARAVLPHLLVFFTLATVLPAGDLQTWSEAEYTLARSGRFSWSADGNLRFAQTIGDLYDRRAATRFDYQLGKSVSLSAGYMFGRVGRDDVFANENRVSAGISYPLAHGALDIKGTTLYERHFVPLSDFNRYRQRFEITRHDKSLSPWIYEDLAFRQGVGFVRSRSRVGLRWRLRTSYALKLAYQFESLSTGIAWVPRHALYTEVSVDKPFWTHE